MAANADQEHISNMWYINLPIQVAPGLELTPEIGAINQGDLEQEGTTVSEGGTMSWVSVRFAVSF